MTSNKLTSRLASLREEYAKGERMLQDAEREAAELRESLLRISGAIRVLEELENESTEDEKE